MSAIAATAAAASSGPVPLLELPAERAAVDQLHRDERPELGIVADLMDADDVQILDARELPWPRFEIGGP